MGCRWVTSWFLDQSFQHVLSDMLLYGAIAGQVRQVVGMTSGMVGCRWFTSWFVHQSFQHVLSNMLLFGAIACQIEEKYGAPRIVLLFFISALGGAPSCTTLPGPVILPHSTSMSSFRQAPGN